MTLPVLFVVIAVGVEDVVEGGTHALAAMLSDVVTDVDAVGGATAAASGNVSG